MGKDNYRGQTKIMNNGFEATIIEFRDFYDIDIMLSTGLISKHQKYHDFQRCDAAALGFPINDIVNEPNEIVSQTIHLDIDCNPLLAYDYLHLERKV